QLLQSLEASRGEELGYFEFIQWVADRQLAACRDKAHHAGLPIGLYLDIAVGVRPDGFDAWYNQDLILPTLESGAQRDQLNTKGQRWGLAGVNPASLIESGCKPFRDLLRASMQFAGAIRLDHILGLKRLYLVPKSMQPEAGAYGRFPFESILAVAGGEKVAKLCLVVREGPGTLPPGFQDTLALWGISAFQVLLFQRAADGGFIAPDLYRPDALVTFATHDLPTFSGWEAGHDLLVQRRLGLDPGESDEDRAAARNALGRAMAWRGLPSIDYLSVTRFLADTPSRVLMVTLEDALGQLDQVNLPGTINEHPNWRRPYAVALDELSERSNLRAVAGVMDSVGRHAHRHAHGEEIAAPVI